MADRDDILDVELRIVGQESLGPLAQLTEQLSKITQYQTGIGAMSSEARTAGMRGFTQGGRNFPVQSGTTGTGSVPPIIPEQEIERKSGIKARLAHSALEYSREEQRQAAERASQGIIPRSTSLHRHRPIEDAMVSSYGSPSSAGSTPPTSITEQILQSDPMAYQLAKEPFVYPQFGNMTAQDRLMFLGGITQKLALKGLQKRKNQAEQTDEIAAQAALDAAGGDVKALQMPEATKWDTIGNWDTTTAHLRRLGGAAGAAQGVVKDAKWLMNRIGGAQNAGIQAGYNKAGSINIGPFGITNPLELLGHGSAGKESMRQWWTTQRLRWKGGIDGAQAKEIQNSLAALGWTGNQGQGIALDTIAPLVQQGLNPTMTSTMFDKSFRHGNSTIKEFNKTMDKLGESARASKMSLDEFQKGLDAAGDAAKQQGGFYRQGMDAARQFSDSTGLGPQALSQSWGSPLVQGMSMAKYGIMPNAMGTMTGNMGTNSIFSSLDIAKQATSMFATRNTIDPQTGQRISGKEAQYAQMAPLMGMSVGEIRRLDQQAPLIKASSRATGRLDTYTRMLGKNRAEENAKVKELMDKNPSMTKADARRVFEGTMRSGDIANIGWDSVERSMYQTAGLSHGGLSQKERKEISRISHLSGDDRVKAANSFLRDQSKFPTPSDPNTITVKFTGAAEKLLMVDKNTKAEQNKINAASGGTPSNSYTTSPQGATTNAQAQAIIDSMRATRGADNLPSSSVPAGNAP